MNLLKKQRWLQKMGPPVAFLLGRALWPTMHLEVFGSEHLASAYQKYGQAILAFWHNRLLLFPFIYRYRMHLKNIVIMVSESRDGELVANFLERFDFYTIRGSSSKGGGQAFTQAIRMARRGFDIAITPDGPRGPRYQVHPGVIKLAQITSLPIVPVAYQVSLRRELGSWDGFILPAPFTRVAAEIAPVLTVPRRAGQQQIEQARIHLQHELERLNASTLVRLTQRGQPASVIAKCVGDRRD